MRVQIRLVRGKLADPQDARAPVDALAHLTADLAEAAPAKPQAWERPLEDGDALACDGLSGLAKRVERDAVA
jgi:hypothetical protein